MRLPNLVVPNLVVQLGLEEGQINNLISLVKVGFGLVELIDNIFAKVND